MIISKTITLSDADKTTEHTGRIKAIDSYLYLAVDPIFQQSLHALILKHIPNQIIQLCKHTLKETDFHISILYPNEVNNQKINLEPFLNQQKIFYLEDLYTVFIKKKSKMYYVIRIYAPQLEKIRLHFNLNPMLTYLEDPIFFHLTLLSHAV